MLNTTTIVVDRFCAMLDDYYRMMYGSEQPIVPLRIAFGARLILEQVANSDALYHNMQHTILVTSVGQEIFRGRFLKQRLSPSDWLHYTAALLCHDIGYVRGVCPGDAAPHFVIDAEGNTVTAPRGASDAFLTPYHVDRGKIFVRSRLKGVPEFDEERVAMGIELTRFPVPDSDDHKETGTEAGLVRAADLIGQLSDPNYPQRLTALYYEFVETGVAERLGYRTAADLAEAYPRFFWDSVRPYIMDAIAHLQLTQEGKQWIANLYAHVFAMEHGQYRFGPVVENGNGPNALGGSNTLGGPNALGG